MSLSLKSLVIGGGSGGGYDPDANSSSTNGYTGFVYYGDGTHTASNPQVLRAGVPSAIQNDGTIDYGKSYVSKDLANFDFIVDDKFFPKNVGDTYLLRLTFKALSGTIDNALTVRLKSPVVVQQNTESFVTNPGDESMFTFNYHVSCLQEFKNSGGTFEAVSDYDSTLWAVGLLVIPVSRL